jgi:two-component system LytT family response regulator
MFAYIIEDEPHAQKALQQLIQMVAPDIHIGGVAATAAAGIDLIRSRTPDLIFLDVKLGQETGFDILRHFPNPSFAILFVTAFNEFAIEAFRWNALHYITKPVDSKELKAGIDRVRKPAAEIRQEQVESLLRQLQTKEQPNHLILRYDSIVERQPLDAIICLEADGGMTYFYCLEDDFRAQRQVVKRKAVSTNIGQYERLLPPSFFRCHQSHIVNRKFVKFYDRSGNTLSLTTDQKIPVSRRGKEGLEDWMAEA